MNLENVFVNRRYLSFLDVNYPVYCNNNGVMKKCLSGRFALKMFPEEKLWYCLNDLPESIRENVMDVAISIEEIDEHFQKRKTHSAIYDGDGTQIFVKDDVLILPIVGNLLPSDGTPAFTVVTHDEKPHLEPILVCWGCHWSELFTGQTKYGFNVFCLVSDLTKEQIDMFVDDIICLGDSISYLEELNREKKDAFSK